jgi:dolichol-phosphate mannosyltransferase
MGRVVGVGATIRQGLEYVRSLKQYDIIVWMAGNNKDDPAEISRLLDPIIDQGYDFVQGSRFLRGGGYGGDMPFYRKIATKLHPALLSLFSGKRLTESTNGFRAVRLSVFDDRRINLSQAWLDEYELEVYMLFKVLKLGYRHKEVPCTKIYPPKKLGITKMKPITGWWSILRPVFLLGLGLRT